MDIQAVVGCGLRALWLCLSLHVVFEEEVFAVVDGIGEESYPVAEDDHPCGAREHEVVVDVSVSEDEEVDVGMVFEVGFCEEDEVFLVFAHEGRFLSVLAFQPASACPFQSEGESDVGMQDSEESLADAAVEDGAQESESA